MPPLITREEALELGAITDHAEIEALVDRAWAARVERFGDSTDLCRQGAGSWCRSSSGREARAGGPCERPGGDPAPRDGVLTVQGVSTQF